MGVNKVEYGSSTLVDLTGDTVTPETLLQGETAHNAAGDPITGTAKPGVQSFNGRSGSVLPIAGDYSADQVNYDSNKTVKQVIDALATKEASDITGQQSLLKDTVGWTGKNLLKNTGKNTTSNGITTTINADKSITLNGTATSGDNACFLYGTGWGQNYYVPINETPFEVGETYIMSKGSSDETARLIFYFYNGNTYITDAKCIQKDVTFTIPQNTTHLACIAKVNNGATVSNLTFYPMIRKADITDPTYEPYHESVEVMYEEEIHGVNLIDTSKYTFKEDYGITWTKNSDGSWTANGTATNCSYVNFTTRADNNNILKANTAYIVSGVPNQAHASIAVSTNTGDPMRFYYGSDGYIAPVNYDRSITFQINIDTAGTTVNNVTFKPMLRKADIEDSTYRPYNPQAIQNQLNNKGVLGAKNLLPNELKAKTVGGVTVTINDDNSVTLNGTATETLDNPLELSSKINDILEVGKRYVLTGCPANGGLNSYALVWRLNNASAPILPGVDDGDGSEFTWQQFTGYVAIRIRIQSGYTCNNLTFKPMIRLASDPDDTYQPYVMTNRELTEVKNVTVTARTNVTLNAKTNVFKVGKVVSGCLRLEFTGTLTVQQVLATLSDKPVVDTYTIGIESGTNKVMPIIILGNGQVLLFGDNLPTTNNHLIIPVNFITA